MRQSIEVVLDSKERDEADQLRNIVDMYHASSSWGKQEMLTQCKKVRKNDHNLGVFFDNSDPEHKPPIIEDIDEI